MLDNSLNNISLFLGVSKQSNLKIKQLSDNFSVFPDLTNSSAYFAEYSRNLIANSLVFVSTFS